MYQLEIKDPGTLLSVVLRKEITPAQASMIATLLNTNIDYPQFLWLMDGDFDAPEGAGESVEAFRG